MERIVSIIVPVYNLEQYVEKCIESLANQTYKNIQIIIIDDGSVDATGSVCDKLSDEYSFIKVLHIANNGVSNARNIGLDNADGDYIAFVDGDDWVDSAMFETLVNMIESNNADLSVCSFAKKENDEKILHDDTAVVSKDSLLKEALVNDNFGGYIGNKLFKRSLIGNIRFNTDLHCSEDFVFVSQYLCTCKSAVKTQKGLYHYNTGRKDSATSDTAFSYNKLTLLDAYEQIMDIYQTNAPQLLSVIHKNYLKININFKGRYILSKIDDKATLKKLQNNIDEYYKIVMKDNKLSVITKINIAISNRFPALLFRVKRLLENG